MTKSFLRVKRCQGTERGNFKSFMKEECDARKVFSTFCHKDKFFRSVELMIRVDEDRMKDEII